MARPHCPSASTAAINVAPSAAQWVARCRFRDLDGVTRTVERWGKSKTAARLALQDELRAQRGERTEMLRPESRFREAAVIWMGKIRERRADSTADTYDHCLHKQVLPQLGELRLHECDVAQLDAFFTRLERARTAVEQPGRHDHRDARLRGQHAPPDPRHRQRSPPTGRAPQGDPDQPCTRAGAHRVPEGPPRPLPRAA